MTASTNERVHTWILLRGLSREAGHWAGFPILLERALERQQGRVRVLTLDLPGAGVYHKERSPSSVEDIVERCRHELHRQKIEGPWHLLAMSLGAMVAAEWASRYPDDLVGAVLINTSMKPFSPFYRRLKPTNYLTLTAMGLWRWAARWRERRVLALTSRLAGQREAVLEHWVALHRKHPVSGLNVLRQLWAAMRYKASRGRPFAPMLLLCSQGDDLVDWHCSKHLSRAWGLPLRMHTRAGHDLPLDDANWVANAVVDWLRKRELFAQATTEPLPPKEWRVESRPREEDQADA